MLRYYSRPPTVEIEHAGEEIGTILFVWFASRPPPRTRRRSRPCESHRAGHGDVEPLAVCTSRRRSAFDTRLAGPTEQARPSAFRSAAARPAAAMPLAARSLAPTRVQLSLPAVQAADRIAAQCFVSVHMADVHDRCLTRRSAQTAGPDGWPTESRDRSAVALITLSVALITSTVTSESVIPCKARTHGA